jgi:hypothetical protein
VRVTPARTAEIVAEVACVTAVVVTVKVAVVAPAATVTFVGTVAAAESSDSETTRPPVGAGALNVTVPVDALPPTTLAGLSDTAESAGPLVPAGLSVSVALFVAFWYDAEMDTVVVAVTCAVLTLNVARVCPAGTTTLFGTTASTVLLLASVTTAFPVGAADCNVTVAVEEAPPVTVFGLSVTEETALETIRNKFVLTVVPFKDAETLTAVVCVTGAVVAVKVALV